jgi:hypothetical protein
VSTVVYPELTTRLAMNIGSARSIQDVDDDAWVNLARDAGFRPAFVSRTVSELLERAARAAATLIAAPEHDNDAAQQISERVDRLASQA